MPPPVDINTLRQALMAQAMRSQAPSYPVNPAMGTQPTGALPSGMPNTPGQPIPQVPQPPSPPMNNATPPPGAPSPAQGVAKAAQQAQSPLLEPQTRDLAKALVMKLMQHL
jgi:hypothetical protein